MTLSDLENKKIAIVGMGVNNQHLAEYFRNRGVKFDVVEGWKTLDDLVGKLDDFDIIFRTPGLPYLSAAIQQAKKKGVVIYSQIKLFSDLCPCPIIGVTGTKGKGTTATLISRILEQAGKKAWLGGNIGKDPFEFLENIEPHDFVVLELSSFQLQDLHSSPHIAVVLKITPEHLDYHKSLEEYFEAKKPILKFQSVDDFSVLNYDQEVVRNFANFTPANKVWNSIMQTVKPGCFVQGEDIILATDGEPQKVMTVGEVKLIGRFNLENITAAIAASSVAGVTDVGVMRQAVAAFEGLPHRLEFVAEVKGVKFYNDSFSTTPETAVAALTAFEQPLILIAGGSEKNSDYAPLAEAIAKSKLKALVPIGLTGPKIIKFARAAGYEGKIIDEDFKSMEQIVAAANGQAQSGDVVLFSPASASFDMFHDYKHRGELFKKFVGKLNT